MPRDASVVLDTNVPVVANGGAGHVSSSCLSATIRCLVDTRSNCRILLDDQSRILDEYFKHLNPGGQPGPGDAFMKWLWDNQANQEFCLQVPLNVVGPEDTDFAEFPGDPALAAFDRSDRKFVAVAIASELNPIIKNASDQDWWLFREALLANGVQVEFVCPELMHD